VQRPRALSEVLDGSGQDDLFGSFIKTFALKSYIFKAYVSAQEIRIYS